MGQFKPMVKMETTEPTVELKLKKGGHVSSKKSAKAEQGHKPMHKADGGMMGALAGAPSLVGRPVSASPVATPMKPSMAARRKAMMAKPKIKNAPVPVSGLAPVAPPAPPMAPPMKKGGKAKGGKAHEDAAEDRAMIKKALAGKKYATGGVVMGQGGFAKGGGVNGNVSGTPAGKSNTKTGGVKKSNAGGYKKGGATKKFADGGFLGDDASINPNQLGSMGMQQQATSSFGIPTTANANNFSNSQFGNKGNSMGGRGNPMGGRGRQIGFNSQFDNGRNSSNNMINQLSMMPQANTSTNPNLNYDTTQFKKSGGAAKKYAKGGAIQDDGKAVKMPQGRKQPTKPVYINQLAGTFKKGGKVNKFAEGGKTSDDEYMEQMVRDKKMDRATNKGYENASKTARELEDAMNPLGMIKGAFGKMKDSMFGSKLPSGSVTKTKESVTVAKKRGGKC